MRIGVVGGSAMITGYGLAGAVLYPAEDAQAARQAWDALPSDVGLVLLTAEAACALEDRLHQPGAAMFAVLPQ